MVTTDHRDYTNLPTHPGEDISLHNQTYAGYRGSGNDGVERSYVSRHTNYAGNNNRDVSIVERRSHVGAADNTMMSRGNANQSIYGA